VSDDVRLTGDWAKASRILGPGGRGAQGRIGRAIDRALLQEAQWFRREVIRGIRSQAPGGRPFVPLKPATIARKGSSKALIDTGALIRSIQVRRVSGGVFVGVLRTARSASGTGLADIAQIHEFGAPGAGIPPRPFLQPVEDRHGPGSPRRMLARIAGILGGDFGRFLFPIRG